MSLIEILVILTLALVILGPEKLPPLVRQLGKLMRQLRSAADEIRHVIELEGLRDDLRRPLDDLRGLRKELDPYQAIRAEEQAWKKGYQGPAKTSQPPSATSPPPAAAPPQSPWYDEAPEARPEVQRLTLPEGYGDEGAPRALDEHLRLIPLARRLGWGSLDAQIEAAALPAVPVGFLAELRAVPLRGGALELRVAEANAAPAARPAAASLSSVPLRPRLGGSWRRPQARPVPLRRGAPEALRAVPLPSPKPSLTEEIA